MKWFEEFPKPTTEAWISEIRKSVKDPAELAKLVWDTPEGFRVNSFYRQEDLPETPVPLFAARPWEIRQVIYTDKIMAANQSALKALENGADSLLFKGSQAPSEAELDALFNQVHLDWFSHHYDMGESNMAMLYLLIDYFRSKGYDTGALKGSILYDPLGDLYLTGNYEYSRNDMVEIMKTMLETVQTQLPGFRLLTVNTVPLRNSGGNAVQELGTAISQMVEYLHLLSDAGIPVANVLPHLQFQLGTGGAYFMEVAKYRALRLLYRKVMAAYGISGTEPAIHAVSSERNKTVYDPYTNMLRSAAEAMAAVTGGADSVMVLPFDETFRMPDEFSYRMTRNLQLVLKEETGLHLAGDVAAGAYYVEVLTQKLSDAAWEFFLQCEKHGGYTGALSAKYIQQEVQAAALRQQQEFTDGKLVLIGTNKYPQKDEVKSGEFTRVEHPPLLRPQLAFVPLRPSRLSENLENQRLKMETDKASLQN